ncbi:hypothetical protein [Leucobacter luti]|nr:hypothetical protein [Leucobacter luti]
MVLVTTLAGVLSAVLDPRLRAAEALRGSDALAAGGVTGGGHSPDGAVR